MKNLLALLLLTLSFNASAITVAEIDDAIAVQQKIARTPINGQLDITPRQKEVVNELYAAFEAVTAYTAVADCDFIDPRYEQLKVSEVIIGMLQSAKRRGTKGEIDLSKVKYISLLVGAEFVMITDCEPPKPIVPKKSPEYKGGSI